MWAGPYGIKVIVILTSYGGVARQSQIREDTKNCTALRNLCGSIWSPLSEAGGNLKNMWVSVIGSRNKWGREIVLCQRHSLISITHIILISSLGFIPGEQLILNNSSLCCSLSSNHLEAGIRNACTESEPMSHHSQATLLDHTSPKTNLESLKILISNLPSLLTDFVTKDACEMTYLIYLHKTLIHFFFTFMPKKRNYISWDEKTPFV